MLKMMYEHFKTICKHKWIVCLECIKCGFIWRGLMHDNSKFSPNVRTSDSECGYQGSNIEKGECL